MSASLLRLDAVRIMKAALAGTATEKFISVIEAAFETTEEKVPETQGEETEVQPEPEPELVEPSTSRGHKRKAAPTSFFPQQKKKTPSHPSKGICPVGEATPYYPTVTDTDRFNHAGVDDKFISSRISSTITKDAGYRCCYSEVMKAEGKIVKDCPFISSAKLQLSTHIRQHHLGIAVACYVCGKQWWSAHTWFEHMKKVHSSLKSTDYFIREGISAEDMKAIVVKKEIVDTEDL